MGIEEGMRDVENKVQEMSFLGNFAPTKACSVLG